MEEARFSFIMKASTYVAARADFSLRLCQLGCWRGAVVFLFFLEVVEPKEKQKEDLYILLCTEVVGNMQIEQNLETDIKKALVKWIMYLYSL